MNKNHAQTVEKAFIDIEEYEAPAELTFVCLSRAKWLEDLLLKSMPFDRLSKLDAKPTLRLRLVEEQRLQSRGL